MFLAAISSDSAANASAAMAASSLAIVPTLIVLIVAQKYLIQGMTAGAVKG
jgi:ABC-type glycerol-3-phosphate transport system permease component